MTLAELEAQRDAAWKHYKELDEAVDHHPDNAASHFADDVPTDLLPWLKDLDYLRCSEGQFGGRKNQMNYSGHEFKFKDSPIKYEWLQASNWCSSYFLLRWDDPEEKKEGEVGLDLSKLTEPFEAAHGDDAASTRAVIESLKELPREQQVAYLLKYGEGW